MRRGELSFEEEERFSRLSELPELLEGLGVGISGDSVMQALAWNLFAGASIHRTNPPPRHDMRMTQGHA